MDLGIAGKTALITASSKGLGRSSALALAQEGANVVICARSLDALEKTADDIRKTGAECLAIPADVTDPMQPAHLVKRTVDHFGDLDILVANAGGPPQTQALDVTDEQINQAINNNLTTSVRLVREALPHMQANKWGRVCLITSINVKQPTNDLTLSNLSRTGLWAWAKTAAQDIFDEGITINVACPGYHSTDRVISLGHSGTMGDPDDFGAAVAFLCSDQAKFISGTALSVDGARTIGLL